MFISRRHMSSYLILALLCLFCGFLAREDYQIIWLSNLMTLSIPDEGYSRNVSYILRLDINFLANRGQAKSSTQYLIKKGEK